MNRELRAAFLSTRYGPPGKRFELSSAPGLPPAWASGSWALVTAWNPGGQRVASTRNARAGAALLDQVRAAGFTPVGALNGAGEWAEAALLVPGARLRQAANWGAHFGQAAILWGVGARVALVWLEGGRVVGVERCWAVVAVD